MPKTTQQEELGPRVTEKPSFQIGENGEKRVSIIPINHVTEFKPFASIPGRYAKKDGIFQEGVLIDSETQTVPGGHGVGTFTVKLDGNDELINFTDGPKVPEYFFMVYPPSGGKNKRNNRKSTKSKKSKKSKKSRKNRKKTIRRR